MISLPEDFVILKFFELGFYPKYNKKDGVQYDGEKDLESLKKWVEQNSSIIMESELKGNQEEEKEEVK